MGNPAKANGRKTGIAADVGFDDASEAITKLCRLKPKDPETAYQLLEIVALITSAKDCFQDIKNNVKEDSKREPYKTRGKAKA